MSDSPSYSEAASVYRASRPDRCYCGSNVYRVVSGFRPVAGPFDTEAEAASWVTGATEATEGGSK